MGTRKGQASAPGTPRPAAPRPLHLAVASHEAHYWFVATRLLASLAPGAPPIKGVRRRQELTALLQAVLIPTHPNAIAASRTSVGQLGFGNAVEVLARMKELEVPATPHPASVTLAATSGPDGNGLDPAAVHAMLTREATTALAKAGFAWRWTR